MRMPRVKPDQSLTYFHVMTRTCQQAFNLDEKTCPGFKETCHQIISAMASIYHVQIFAWVYMDNHIHLALSVSKPDCCEEDIRTRYEKLQQHLKYPRPWRSWYLDRYYSRFTDLSRFMWEINMRIALAYNRRFQTKGHFWGGRFKSKVLENEDALLRVMAYIEQNPVKAKLCQVPSQYPYCSAGRAKRKLRAGKMTQPRVPAIGPFKKMSGRFRAECYVMWMDHQSRLLLGKVPLGQSPPEITAILLGERECEEWRKAFARGAPSDWRTQSYGSTEFERHIKQLERRRRQALDHQMYLKQQKQESGS